MVTQPHSVNPNQKTRRSHRFFFSFSLSPLKKIINKKSHRAKTPIISAIVSSSVVVAIWTLIFLAWLWKQYKKRVRAKRRAAKGLPPKVKKSKKPLPTFILPPDPAVITGQREPGERAIPKKHNSIDKHAPNAFELNERTRPVTEGQIHDEMIARQVFSKRSSLDPPKHEKPKHDKRSSHQPPPPRCRFTNQICFVTPLTLVCQHQLVDHPCRSLLTTISVTNRYSGALFTLHVWSQTSLCTSEPSYGTPVLI